MPANVRTLVVTSAVAIAALLLLLFWSGGASPAASDGDRAVQLEPGIALPASTDLAASTPEPTTVGRTVIDVLLPVATAGAEPAPAILRCRLLDCRGHPIAGAPVVLHVFEQQRYRFGDPIGDPVPSDASGVLAFVVPPGLTVAPKAGAGYATLRTTCWWPGREVDCVVVAAPAVALTGYVRNEAGAPLAGALVQIQSLMLTEFPLPLEQTFGVPFETRVETTADGRFALDAHPLAPGVDLLVTREGYASRRVPCLEGQSGSIEITLHKLVAAAGRIHGFVLDGAGRPVADAALQLGEVQRAQSAADGAFAFEYPKEPTVLVATRRGFLPAVREGVGQDTPVPLVVELGAAALAITGQLVDAAGRPVSGWLVTLADPEINAAYALLERLSAPGGTDLPFGAFARTDADGRFLVGGLLDRSYRLRAFDDKTALAIESEPVRAGSAVTLRIPADACVDELQGVVADRQGRGIAGASISVFLLASKWGNVELVHRLPVTTVADGSFTLRGVPRRHVTLSVIGQGLVYQSHRIEDCLLASSLRLEVARSCHVQIEGEIGLVVTFLDAAGKVLSVSVHSVGVGYGGNGWHLRAPKSPVMTVSEEAVTMVWARDGKEVGRKAINLVPGTVTTLLAAR